LPPLEVFPSSTGILDVPLLLQRFSQPEPFRCWKNMRRNVPADAKGWPAEHTQREAGLS